MLDGQVTTECDGTTYDVNIGDMILFHSKSIHSIFKHQDAPASYLVLQFDLYSLNRINTESTRFRSLLTHAKNNQNAPILLTAHELEPFPIENLFRECNYERSHSNFGYDLIMTSNISRLLTYILRIWRTHGFDTVKVMVSNNEETEFDQILEYIDSHSNEALLVTDLAKRCNMSYSNFAKLFKQIYGKSCKDYIEFIKITKTQDMLLFTDYDLNYISQEAGFSDCSHFIKTYKKVIGITPKQHKLQLLRKK
jgi:AraC-like DNA-binding protein